MPRASLAHRSSIAAIHAHPTHHCSPVASPSVPAHLCVLSSSFSGALRVLPQPSPSLQCALHHPSRPHRMFLYSPSPVPVSSMSEMVLFLAVFIFRSLSWLYIAVPLHFE
ncbi:Piso0_000115 [Millerozyma farinosa CBS 7064]|uniref:Piso0_000115 protein n=1 Tax=Pichia sorbitophila (strain ATCC MYA-4447 / BCRC 22081 / CBS 7064 / NBRC 10061 / NRRL Y-12695) TaxID=559304 RepID=G8YT45_PICSO|nr:Piso0_000115 [Millerozyma farinosa CBS 7064]